MQRQILVLGANGFIGNHLMARLRACPWANPIAGVRRPPASMQTEHRIVEATSEVSVAQGLAGIDAVVNCVAGDATSIIQGARALFAAAARMPAAPRVVHLSTMSVYGEANGLIDETAPLRGDLGAYSAAKVAAEQYAAGYERSVILRPGCVYGPASPQWSLRIAQWLIARRLGDLGADGDGYCNLVHVDDVATAILHCLEAAPPPGAPPADAIFNLSMPEPPTWNEYLIRYGRALGAVPVRRISHRRLTLETKLVAPPLKILELGLRAAKLRWHVPPPIPPSLLRLMRQEIKLDVQRAQAAFGFGWKPLDAGLAETARWYLQGGARA